MDTKSDTAMNNSRIVILPKLRDDSVLFSSDDARAQKDMNEIYFCAGNRDSLSAALHALYQFDDTTAKRFAHLYQRFPITMHEITESSVWCTDAFISAALHSYCSDIDSTLAGHTVRYLRTTIVQASVFVFNEDAEANPRNFLLRLGIEDRDFGDPMMTVFNAQSRVRAVVLPLHSEKTSHWSMLVFYRLRMRSPHWFAMHYDTLSPLHENVSRDFVRKFCASVRRLEPDFRLVRPLEGTEVDIDGEQLLVTEFRRTPRQHSGWECGYKTIMMSLAVALSNGNVIETNALIQSDRYTCNVACARYIARTLEKLAGYMFQLSVRRRCRNLFDFSADIPKEPASDDNVQILQ
jgi:hypothetical protein